MSGTETVLRFLNAMVLHDFDAAMAFIDDDVIYDNKPLAMLKGKRKFDIFLRPWVERHDEISILIHSITEAGDLVVVERTDRHRLTGGAWASTQAAGFYRLREDRIVEWRDYFDLMPFCIQSGQSHEDIVRLAEKLAAAP